MLETHYVLVIYHSTENWPDNRCKVTFSQTYIHIFVESNKTQNGWQGISKDKESKLDSFVSQTPRLVIKGINLKVVLIIHRPLHNILKNKRGFLLLVHPWSVNLSNPTPSVQIRPFQLLFKVKPFCICQMLLVPLLRIKSLLTQLFHW